MTGTSVSESMVVLVSGKALVVVPRSTGTSVIHALRRVVAANGSGDELITTLLAGGLAQLPSLGAVVREADGVRFLVRGSVVLDVETGEGESLRLSAPAALATWREEVLPAAAAVTVRDAEGTVQAEWFTVDLPRASDHPVPVVATAAPLVGEEAGEGSDTLDAAVEAEPVEAAAAEQEQLDPATVDPEPLDDTPVEEPGLDADPAPVADEVGDEVGDEPHPEDEPESVDVGSLTLAGPFDDSQPPFMAERPAPPPPVDDTGFDFAHLLEETQYRGVEAAAIRVNDEELSPAADGTAGDIPEPTAPVAPSAPDPGPAWSPPPEPSPVGGASGLISGVPGLSPPTPSATASAQPDGSGDHDGLTIAKSQLSQVLGNSAGAATPEAAAPAIKGPAVQAVHCALGHPNPAHAEQCRMCGGPIADRNVRPIPRPVLGRLRFSTGPLVELDRPQVIGRRPTADLESSTAELPALVTLQDPDHSLSRTHAEIRLEGWEVFVVDRSKNGTVVDLPGQAPLRLRSGEPCLIVTGTRVHLSDSHDFVFEIGDR